MRDPLSNLVIERLSPLRFALILLGIALAVDAISFALVGSKVIELSGWTDTWAYGVYLYVVFPAVAGAYIWVARAAPRLFRDLGQSEALIAREGEYNRFVCHTLQPLYTHLGWTIASLVVVVLVAVYYAFIFTLGWPRIELWLRVLKVLVVYVPGWYMICHIVAREIVTIWGLWQVFRRFEISALWDLAGYPQYVGGAPQAC